MKRTNYIIANWKMNGTEKSISLVKSIQKHILKKRKNSAKIVICPPFTALSSLIQKSKKITMFGAQDVHHEKTGAFTGSISALMLNQIGVKFVIIGHSERRQYQKESISELSKKINSALSKNLKVIFCIGETLDEIKKRSLILKKQLTSLPNKFSSKDIIIAYEPVWAIGTGKTASPEQAQAVHLFIRDLLGESNESIAQSTPILYGGSMNAGNASELISCADIDGGLIGGAALKVEDFLQISKAG